MERMKIVALKVNGNYWERGHLARLEMSILLAILLRDGRVRKICRRGMK